MSTSIQTATKDLSEISLTVVSATNNLISLTEGLVESYKLSESYKIAAEEDKAAVLKKINLQKADNYLTFVKLMQDFLKVSEWSDKINNTSLTLNAIKVVEVSQKGLINPKNIIDVVSDLSAIGSEKISNPLVKIFFAAFSQFLGSWSNYGKFYSGAELDKNYTYTEAQELILDNSIRMHDDFENSIMNLRFALISYIPDGVNPWNGDIDKLGHNFIGDQYLRDIDGNGEIDVESKNDNFTGSAYGDRLHGLSGNDYLYGGKGGDYIDGGQDNDYLYGGQGSDTLIGSEGQDKLYGGSGSDTLYGGNDDDHLYAGDVENDLADLGTTNRLYGENGNDLLYGGGGKDHLYGGENDDYLEGGSGDDRLVGGLGKDTLEGGDGNDILIAGNSGDQYNKELDMYFLGNKSNFEYLARFDTSRNILIGGEGNDIIYGSHGNDQIYTGKRVFNPNANDYINVELSDKGSVNTVYGYAGKDTILGAAGQDILYGGAGEDHLYGGDHNDVLFGDADNDYLYGGDGNDYLNGGLDNDELYGGNGNDILVGGQGQLKADGGDDNDIIYADSTNTSNLLLADELDGGKGNDIIYGYNGENKINGGEGNDILYGGVDKDEINGGLGNNLINGGNGENILIGASANDLIIGGNDKDIIRGYGGTNLLKGGAGQDEYKFNTSIVMLGGLGTNLIQDQNGKIEIDNNILDVGEYDHDIRAWRSGNGQYIIRKLGEDTDKTIISIYKDGDQKNSIYIDGWKNNGDMGLYFTNPVPNAPINKDNNFKGGSLGNNLIANLDANATSWTVYAYSGNDYISTTMFSDYIEAGEGNDFIEAVDGDDLIYGGDGDDSISAGPGKDEVYGGRGNDLIFSAAFTPQWNDIEYIYYTGIYGEGWQIANNLKIFDFTAQDFSGFDYKFENKSNNLFAQGKYLDNSDIFYPDLRKYIVYDNKYYEAGRLDYYLGHEPQKTSSTGIPGADTLYGGQGDDYIVGSGDNDVIKGEEDQDYILGMQGNDYLYGGQGEDHIFGGTGRDYISGGNNNDFLVGDYEGDVIYGGDDDDIIYGDLLIVPEKGIIPTNPDINRYGDDLIYGGSGDDKVWGGGGNDIIYGGTGNDELRGEDGNDFIYGDDDEDHLWGGQGDDYLFGGAQKDFLDGGIGNDFLFGEADDDTIKGGENDDIIYGGADSDKLYGDAGNDIVFGDDGIDYIYGGLGDDIISGGGGNDHLEGGAGSDLYVFSLGDGHDKIIETVSDLASLNHQNFIYFNFDSSQARDVVRDGFDLIIKYGVDDQVTVKNYYMVRNTSKNGYLEGQELFEQIEISEVRFENGEVWDTATIMEMAPPPEVNELPPASLQGVAYFIDALVTREEILVQQKNVLTYSFPTHNASGQQDFDTEQILAVEQALDKFAQALNLSFVRSETGQSDIQFYLNDLIEVGAGAAAGYADAQTGEVHLNALIFNTSSSLNEGTQGFETLLHEIGHLLGLEHPFEAPVLPVEENHQDNTIMSYTSNGVYDTELKIYDIAALHYFYGVNSNVRAESNTYTFADRYIWDGSGLDTFDASMQTEKVYINLNAGSWNYIAEKSLSILDQGQSFIGYGTMIENVKGGTGDDTLIGNVQNNILEGGLGQDTYIFNENFGQDQIIEIDSINKIKFDFDVDESRFYYSDGMIYYKNDSIRIDVDNFELFGINGVDYSLDDFKNKFILVDRDYFGTENEDFIRGNAGNNKIYGGSGNDCLEGGLGNDILYGGNGNDELYGGDGDDKLYAESGNNILDGGAGNDTLDGGIGTNTFIFGKGYGHDIIASTNSGNIVFLDLNPTDIVFKIENNDLRILSKNTNDSLLLQKYCNNVNAIIKNEIFKFADGTIWNKDNVREELLKGTLDNDTILGHYDYENVVNGLAGNDIIWGNNKNDKLYGGDGNDELYGGEGDDELYGGDGNDGLYGGGGDDQLYGGAFGNKILDGGAGNDILDGGSIIGSNTFIFGTGYGHDIITHTNNGNIVFVDLNPTDVIFRLENNDLHILSKYTDDSLLFQNYYSDINTIIKNETFEFADGTIWTKNEVRVELLKGTPDNDNIRGTYGQDNLIRGLAGDDIIVGNNKKDELYGDEGNDQLYGGDGNDQLYGGAGNDTLDGGLGNDIFYGGIGNDSLYGGGGNDTYIFDSGFGQDDLLNLQDSTGTSKIIFNNTDSKDIYFVRDEGNFRDLLVKIRGTNDVLKIKSFFDYDPYLDVKTLNEIDVILVDQDSTLLTFYDIFQKVNSGTTDHDIIFLKSKLDHYIDAKSGDDSINLLDGKYIVNGGDGNDKIIVDQSPISILSGDEGNDEIRVSNSSDSKIYGGNGNDSLSLGGHNGEIYGGSGDDQLRVLTGDNYKIYGGLGYDIYSIADGSKNTLIHDEDYQGKINISMVPFYSVRAGDHISDFVYPLNGNYEYTLNNIKYYHFTKETTRNVDIEYDALLGVVKFVLKQDSSNYSYLNDTGKTKYKSGDVLFYFENIYSLQDFENIKKLDVSINNSENLKVNYSGGSGYQFLSTILSMSDIFDQGVVKSVYGAGNDIIYGVTEHQFDGDHIYAGAGDDHIYTGRGSSRVYGEEGNDYIEATDTISVDEVYGGSGNDIFYNYDPNNNDQEIQLNYPRDTIYGGEGNDMIHISYQSAVVYGGEGNDTIIAGNVATDMSGGVGQDFYIGGLGDDRYYYSIGDGFDIINQTGGGSDIIKLSGIYLDDVKFVHENDDLVLIFNNNPETGILIKDYYRGGEQSIVGIEFEGSNNLFSNLDIENIIRLRSYNGLYDHLIDGTPSSETLYGTEQNDLIEGLDGNDTIWAQAGNDRIEGGAGNDYLDGGEGDDYIYGGQGDDTLRGGKGHDILDGGAGNDKYFYYLADGTETIDQTGGGTDVLWLMDQGITEDRIKFTKENNDLLVMIDNNPNQSVRVKDHFLGGEKAISSVQPNGGYTITSAQIASKVNASSGGTLNPIGDTIYEYTSGAITIAEQSGNDKVIFKNGITFSQVGNYLTKSGDDLILKVNGSNINTVTIKNFFKAGQYLVETLQFETGGQLTAEQIFGAFGLTIPSGTNPTPPNPVGDTTYTYSSGELTITEQSGNDKVIFKNGITFNQVGNYLNKSGDDLVLKINGSNTNKVTVKNFFLAGNYLVENFEIETGGALSAAQIFSAFGLTLPSTDGGNQGSSEVAGDTVYNYTTGALTITEHSGNDKVIFKNGITFNQVGSYLTKSGDDLILKVNGSNTNKVTVKNFFLAGQYLVETFQFETGGQITAEQIFGAFGITMPQQSAPANTPPENMDLDAFNTTYNYSSGAMVIDEKLGTDQVVFGNGITFSQVGNYLTKSGDDLILKVNGSNSNKVTVKDFFLGGAHEVESFNFETGGSISSQQIYQVFGVDRPVNAEGEVTSIVMGDSGDNVLSSDAAVSELFILNEGNDILELLLNASGETAVDYVSDFNVAEDQIDLSQILDSQATNTNLSDYIEIMYDASAKTNTLSVRNQPAEISKDLLIFTNQVDSLSIADLTLNQVIIY